MKYLFSTILILLFAGSVFSQNRVEISGTVKNKDTGETLPMVTIFVEETKTVITTDMYGKYSASLDAGLYTFKVSYIAYENLVQQIDIQNDKVVDFNIRPDSEVLDGVIVFAGKKNANITRSSTSVEKLEMQQIRLMPVLMGEVDLIKALQLLPGVQATSEGTSGFSVRGGSPDQNLILLDNATVYNASHLMGFFSVFNNDAIDDLTLYKGDIPASHGGRLSSLLDVQSHEPFNAKKLNGTGGIGLISSRIMLESPIAKGKSSFFVAGRRTYADLFLKLASDEDMRNSAIYFYDLNGKINYNINKNNRIYLSTYWGNDRFNNKETAMDFGNLATTLRWNHLFSDKFYLNLSATASRYDYMLRSETPSLSGIWEAGIWGAGLRADFLWQLNDKNDIRFGLSSAYHKFQPGNASALIQDSNYQINIPRTQGIESAVFIQNQQQLTDKLLLKYGIRATLFQNVGPTKVFSHYVNDIAVFDTYPSAKIFNAYWALEPRVGAVYNFNDKLSVKTSYSRTTQFLHLLSTSTAGSPLDIWIPVNPNIKPQTADQIVAGVFRNFNNDMYETSVEAYYKNFGNVIDFKDHPDVFANDVIEPELRKGKGHSYGLEFMVRKNAGDLTGWVSYTWSRVFSLVEDINNNKAYPAPFDRPHNVNIVLNYAISKRVSFGLTWVLASGMPVTFPEGRYIFGNNYIPIYSGRNKYRMPAYHRMDASINIDLNKRSNKWWKSELNISVYNLYARKNPWMINFRTNIDGSQYAQMTYLFSIIPSITYNFRF